MHMRCKYCGQVWIRIPRVTVRKERIPCCTAKGRKGLPCIGERINPSDTFSKSVRQKKKEINPGRNIQPPIQLKKNASHPGLKTTHEKGRCTVCGTPNGISLICSGCGRSLPDFVIMQSRAERARRKIKKSVPVKNIASLREQFDSFCNNHGMVQLWSRRALNSASHSLVSIEQAQAEMRKLFQPIYRADNPLQEALHIIHSGQFSTINIIAFFSCFREIFKFQVDNIIQTGQSLHYDVPLTLSFGCFTIRNSFDFSGTGTTRLYLQTREYILDPSYSVICNLIKTIGNEAAIAGFLHRFTLGQPMTSDDFSFLSRSINISINNKDLFQDQSVAQGEFKVFDKPEKPKPHDYSALESLDSKGKRQATIKIGDFVALLWGLFFVAEGRHSPMVAHSNLLLLELIAENRLNFSDCLTNFSYQKDGQKLLEAFSGGLFPSSNFCPYGFQFKTAHKMRYQNINNISKVNGTSCTSLDTFLDNQDSGVNALFDRVYTEDKHADVQLFVMYKIAFIEFLRQEKYPKAIKFSFTEQTEKTPPILLKNLIDIKKLLESLSVYDDQDAQYMDYLAYQSTGDISQFDICGAGTACSPIAVLAIQKLLSTQQLLTPTEINNLVIQGGGIYQAIIGDQQTLANYHNLIGGRTKSKNGIIDGPHLNPYEIPQNVLTNIGLAWGGQRSSYRFSLRSELFNIFSGDGDIGVAIIIGGFTVSVTRAGDQFYLFDSHGFEETNNAFVERHDNLDGIVNRLLQMANRRSMGEKISISIFRRNS